MYRNHSVGVVVPAYNEAELIGGVIREMPDYVDRIYVINDCSTDNTDDAIEAAALKDRSRWADERPSLERENGDKPHNILGTQHNFEGIDSDGENIKTDGGSRPLEERAAVHRPIGRVLPIEHYQNQGAGGAIKTGYLAARRDDMDITATVDGDGQMDLSQMSKLLDPIVEDEADYAKGNRLLYQEYREEMPAFRFLGNSMLTFLTKIASGYWKTMDPQNGYTAISGLALKNIDIESMYEYYGYLNDLLVKLNTKGLRVADVAIPAVYGQEESSISYPTYIRKVSWMLLKNFLWRLKSKYLVLDFHPLALFYLFGAWTAALGIVGGGWSLYKTIASNTPLFVHGSISLLLWSVGILFLIFAMVFDMEVNKNKEVQVRD